MKAISIRQPWAYYIVRGYKDIENRNWATKYRGKILIHASTYFNHNEFIMTSLWVHKKFKIRTPLIYLQRGGIIGEVELMDCVSESDSPWFEGKYGFTLYAPHILPFKKCKGKLGIFNI